MQPARRPPGGLHVAARRSGTDIEGATSSPQTYSSPPRQLQWTPQAGAAGPWGAARLQLLQSGASCLAQAVKARCSAPPCDFFFFCGIFRAAALLQWMIRQSAEVENHATSIERMLAYTELQQVGGARPGQRQPKLGPARVAG